VRRRQERSGNNHQGNLRVLKCLCKKHISGNQKGGRKDVIINTIDGEAYASPVPVRLFFLFASFSYASLFSPSILSSLFSLSFLSNLKDWRPPRP
jgi:hypothetical protein